MLAVDDLRQANLTGVILSRADLQGADLRQATLSEASLSKADLTGTCYDTDTKLQPGADLASLGMRKIANPAPRGFNCQK